LLLVAALNERRKEAIRLHMSLSTVALGLTIAVSTPALDFVRE